MRQIVSIFIGLIISYLSFGQTIQLQVGTSVSKIDWQYKTSQVDMAYNQFLFSPTVFLGINYLNKRYFNLSTNIGYLSKGGRVGEIPAQPPTGIRQEGENLYSKINYLSVNTMVDIKYPINNQLTPYFSIGPRIDYLLSASGQIDEIINISNKIAGLNVGAGIKYKLKFCEIGIRSDYCFNFDKIADWPMPANNTSGGTITDNTFTVNATLGYRIPNDPYKRKLKAICKKQWR